MSKVFQAVLCLAATGAGGVAGAPSAPHPPGCAADDGARGLLVRMVAAYEGVQDYTARLVKDERFGDDVLSQTLDIKFRKPRSIYVGVTDGFGKGRTAIFPSGENDDRVKVKKAVLWAFDASLDPRGSRMMERQHHPITDAGLGYAVAVVDRTIKQAERRGDELVHDNGVELLDRRCTRRIVLSCPTPCPSKPYTVKENDTLWTIAAAAGQDMYVLLHWNRLRGPTGLKAQQQLEIPAYYAPRTELWIDTELELPIKLEMFDRDGQLYERYRYQDLRLNLGIPDSDFR